MVIFHRSSHRAPRLLIGLIVSAGILGGLAGCDKTEDLSGISGTVSVEGTDADSVVVRIYEADDPSDDVSVWSVPARESEVGFEYAVHKEFDHRARHVFAADTTGSDGKFSFPSVPSGSYIIVADGNLSNTGSTHYKERFGWSKPRLISVGGGPTDVGTLRLRPDSVMGLTTLSGNLTFQTDRHYVIEGNLIVRSGAVLTVEPGAVVRMISNRGIRVEAGGELRCEGSPDNYIVLTTDDIVARDPAEWVGTWFDPGAMPPLFRYCRLEYAQTAIRSETDGGIVEYCYIKRVVGEGVQAFGAPPIFRRNVLRALSVGYEAAATSGILIEHNVFQTCDPYSVKLDTDSSGVIFCNWFRDGGGSDTSGRGLRGVIRMDWVQDFDIYQNTVETSWLAITLGSFVDSTVRIHHNDFTRIHTVMYVHNTEERRGPSNPRFNYNCMSSVEGGYLIITVCHHNVLDIHGEANYWNGATSPTLIHQSFVRDCITEPTCPCVLLDPILPTCEEVEALTDTVAGVCQ